MMNSYLDNIHMKLISLVSLPHAREAKVSNLQPEPHHNIWTALVLCCDSLPITLLPKLSLQKTLSPLEFTKDGNWGSLDPKGLSSRWYQIQYVIWWIHWCSLERAPASAHWKLLERMVTGNLISHTLEERGHTLCPHSVSPGVLKLLYHVFHLPHKLRAFFTNYLFFVIPSSIFPFCSLLNQ